MALDPAAPLKPRATNPVCRSCNRPLSPPFQFCAECGASQVKRSQPWAIVAMILGGFFLLLLVFGVLAAIAIPNFLRYQLRAKASEVQENLRAIYRAELAFHAGTGEEQEGHYFAFPNPVPTDGALGRQKMPWTAGDLDLASKLDWLVEASTYARYHVVVAGGEGATEAALSACAETDLDEDGEVAATVLWMPAYAADGSVAIMPPDAPCTGSPVLAAEASLQFRPGIDAPNTPLPLSPPDEF